MGARWYAAEASSNPLRRVVRSACHARYNACTYIVHSARCQATCLSQPACVRLCQQTQSQPAVCQRADQASALVRSGPQHLLHVQDLPFEAMQHTLTAHGVQPVSYISLVLTFATGAGVFYYYDRQREAKQAGLFQTRHPARTCTALCSPKLSQSIRHPACTCNALCMIVQ